MRYDHSLTFPAVTMPAMHRHGASGRRCWLLLLVLAAAGGCRSREWFHQRADADVYDRVAEKSTDPRWAMPNYSIDTDPRSRYFDPTNPDRPPMPQDDPASHVYMHYLDGKRGYRRWHQDGDYWNVENPCWQVLLRDYAEITEAGAVRLTLENSVQLGLIHSPTYRDQIETLYLSALDVTAERFRFDTQFFGNTTPSFTHVGQERPGGETNTLAVNSNLQARKRFATGADLLVNFANSFVWQFAGPDTNFASSLVSFSLVQPLLRAGGRNVVLEQLTIVERALLSNLRAFERYREGFYTNIAIGNQGVGQLQRRGGFFGGTGLTGFTGQGAGGIGGVGQQTFGFGGAGGAAGGAAAGGGGFAAGGEAAVGGFIGLLQQLQQIRNTEYVLDLRRRTLNLLEANREAGSIELVQVENYRQQILGQEATLLQSVNALESAMDNFKRDLGLPPHLQIELDDSMIRQFQFIDPQITESQNVLADFIETFGELPASPGIEEVEAGIARLEVLGQEMEQQFALVQSDLERLDALVPNRERTMTPEERARLLNDLQQLREAFSELRARFAATAGDAQRVREQLTPTTTEAGANGVVALSGSFSSILQDLSLIQARARLESVMLDPIELDSETALAIARANRLDWMNNRAALVDTWRLISFNANALLAGLNINFSGDMGTIRNNAFSFRGQDSTLRASLSFDAPLTRLLERNNYRQSLISYQANRRDLIQYEDTVNQSLRLTLRQMNQFRQNLEIQRNALRLAVVRVDLVLATLREPPPAVTPGQPAPALVATAVLDLVNALSDLQNTQNFFMSVWLNYYAARMSLMRDLGIMQLDEQGLWVDVPFDAAMWPVDWGCPLPPVVPQEWLDDAFRDSEEIDPTFPLPPPVAGAEQPAGGSLGSRLLRSLTTNPLRSKRGATRGVVLQVSVSNEDELAEELLTAQPDKANGTAAHEAKPVASFVPPLPPELKQQKQRSRGTPSSGGRAPSATADPRLSSDPEHPKPTMASGLLKRLEGIFTRR